MRFPTFVLPALTVLAAAPVLAQLALPRVEVPVGLPPVDGAVRGATGIGEGVVLGAQELLQMRLDAAGRLLRKNRDRIERDAQGDLARRGELLVQGFSQTELRAIEEHGFRVIEQVRIEDLELTIARVSTPPGNSLASSERRLAELLPGADVSADVLHAAAGRGGAASKTRATGGVEVGMIDGAPAGTATLSTRGFAAGAPAASAHGSAVASLLASHGAGAIRAADVYGSDPAGGNALAIARALGWLVGAGSKVITISLVGPENAVLAKAIATAQAKGAVIVAAVGNDGPAAPPAFPASYPGVIAVTGVDRAGRVLIEAGRARHLDYAAPGADVYARDAKGRAVKLRGTSYAAPLVAARIAQAMARGRDWRAMLDAEAKDLGRKGPDAVYGRGLVCGGCAAKP